MIQIDPGTVHAIKGGFLILETQQNSDITYRVYDYNRMVDGQPRQLHVAQSIDVINVPDESYQTSIQKAKDIPLNEMCLLAQSNYYKVWKLLVDGECTFEQECPFLMLSVLEGDGIIESMPIKKGDHFIIPYKYGKVSMLGNMEIIISTADRKSVV